MHLASVLALEDEQLIMAVWTGSSTAKLGPLASVAGPGSCLSAPESPVVQVVMPAMK